MTSNLIPPFLPHMGQLQIGLRILVISATYNAIDHVLYKNVLHPRRIDPAILGSVKGCLSTSSRLIEHSSDQTDDI